MAGAFRSARFLNSAKVVASLTEWPIRRCRSGRVIRDAYARCRGSCGIHPLLPGARNQAHTARGPLPRRPQPPHSVLAVSGQRWSGTARLKQRRGWLYFRFVRQLYEDSKPVDRSGIRRQNFAILFRLPAPVFELLPIDCGFLFVRELSQESRTCQTGDGRVLPLYLQNDASDIFHAGPVTALRDHHNHLSFTGFRCLSIRSACIQLSTVAAPFPWSHKSRRGTVSLSGWAVKFWITRTPSLNG